MPTLAPALVTLRGQIDRRFPTRSRASDGWVGDAAHAARGGASVSQHNPNDADVVCAIDVTEDLSVGLDCNRLMDAIDALDDPRVFYLIHDREIDNSDDSRTPYHGVNPHTRHLHISVRWNRPDLYNDGREWAIPMLGAAPPPKPAAGRPMLRRGSAGSAVRDLQARLAAAYPAYRHEHGGLAVDGDFGPTTEAWVREFQGRAGLGVDGIVGPATWKALGL